MSYKATSTFVELFGQKSMPLDRLPTYTDISRHYLSVVGSKKVKISNVFTHVKDVWEKASLSTIQPISIKAKIKHYLDKITLLRKYSSRSKFKHMINKHLADYHVLFDISACKCRNLQSCECKSKISDARVDFIKDQRSYRRMYMDGDHICIQIDTDSVVSPADEGQAANKGDLKYQAQTRDASILTDHNYSFHLQQSIACTLIRDKVFSPKDNDQKADDIQEFTGNDQQESGKIKGKECCVRGVEFVECESLQGEKSPIHIDHKYFQVSTRGV